MADVTKISELDPIGNLSDNDEFVVVDKSIESGTDASSSGKTSKVTLANVKNALAGSEMGPDGEKGVKGIKGEDGQRGEAGDNADIAERGDSGEKVKEDLPETQEVKVIGVIKVMLDHKEMFLRVQKVIKDQKEIRVNLLPVLKVILVTLRKEIKVKKAQRV